MIIKKILSNLDIALSKKEFSELKKQALGFIELLKKHIAKNKVDADVFLGGSFAKNTVAKSEEYDADVFVRFDWKYEDLSNLLEKILNGVVKEGGFNLLRLHGSRDYFKIYKTREFTFEVIPVLRIKNVKQSSNITDLSYFHVNYVKKRLTENMAKEIAISKKFFKAAGVYGAESYINGFSGYGVECLILHYKNFEKMLRELCKAKLGNRFVLDPAKHYKKKENVFFELNESKLHSPIILIDPTWKERNVLASLNWETFSKFQGYARAFLKAPSIEFFEKQEIDFSHLEKLAKQKKGEFLEVVLKTNRQEGDIAGTKMKKFSRYLEQEVGKFFTVLGREFYYSGEGQNAKFWIALKSKGEIIRSGPPLNKKKEADNFEKVNRSKTFRKKGQLYARIPVRFSAKEFLRKIAVRDKERFEEMGIVEVKVK